ncbi:hypothetical protein [Leptolyngbya sp. 7M]|uniref:hypothetical protein n=1 Tax=Leptolyngbya sp. 7M TaxID=2812896 RepID=UPI001B8D5E81|nr:hypothetical protein [Leptolyngbya sp. 7M]QYO62668.1 hypothetical protein JVX88_21810 [Leptolyngbya sp. 7M]
MVTHSSSQISLASSSSQLPIPPMEPTPIFSQKLVDRCHILLPDTPKPTSAIYYEGQYYAYVKFFPTVETARQKAALLAQRGNSVLLTRVPKGLVLWVYEPDAQPVSSSVSK